MYTQVKEYKNSILLTEVKDGITTYHTIKDYKPSLYVKSNQETNIKGFPTNVSLDKIELKSVKDFKDYRKQMKDIDNKLYGNMNPEYQFINDYYDKTNVDKPRVWFMDIETQVVKGKKPNAELAELPVTFIQIYDRVDDKIYILAWEDNYVNTEDDVLYLKCEDEKDLMDKFLKIYFSKRPNIVTGANFVHFDTSYMINRLDNLGYEKNILSPFSKSYTHRYQKFNNNYEVQLPIGVTWIDYIDIIDKHAFLKLPDKKLETLANVVLGEDIGKLNFKRYFKSFYDMSKYNYSPPNDITDEEKEEEIYKAYIRGDKETIRKEAYAVFTRYAILDVRLLKEIDKKLGMMDIMYSYSWAMGCNIEDALKTVTPWDCLLYGSLKEKNKITASFDLDNNKYNIAGGYWNSTPGLYEWIASFDFNSQYPIGACTLNICPSTQVPNDEIPYELKEIFKPLQKYYDKDKDKWIDREDNMFTYLDFPQDKKEKIVSILKENNISMAPNGTCFRKDIKGELPILIEKIFNERVEQKKLMKQVYKDGDENKAKIHNNKQMVLKIQINSLYGYISSQYFKLGSPDLGGAITSFGRYSLMSMKKVVNDKHKEITGKDIIVSNSATDANYFVLSEIVKKRFNDKKPSREEGTSFINVFIDKVLQPLVDSNIDEDFRLMNGYVNLMGLAREIIAEKGLITGISKYTLRVTDDEGKLLIDKPKKKTVGMPNINSSLNKNVKKALDDIVEIIFDEDNNTLIDYIKVFRKTFQTYKPSEISLLTGVSSIEKYKGETKGIYYASKASIIYNDLVKKYNMEDEFELVHEADKVYIIHLKPNPITRADTIAFKEDLFIEKIGLLPYIDYDRHLQNSFISNVERFTKTINWNMSKNDIVMSMF